MLQHQFPFIIDCIYLSDASIREEDDDELSFGKLSLAYLLLSLYTTFMTGQGESLKTCLIIYTVSSSVCDTKVIPLDIARWCTSTENLTCMQGVAL